MTRPVTGVFVRVDGGLGRITLNCPEAINALTASMLDVIADTMREWEQAPDVRAVLLSGAGDRGFCAGGDIVMLRSSALRGDDAAERFWRAEYRLVAQIAEVKSRDVV